MNGAATHALAFNPYAEIRGPAIHEIRLSAVADRQLPHARSMPRRRRVERFERRTRGAGQGCRGDHRAAAGDRVQDRELRLLQRVDRTHAEPWLPRESA